MREKLPVLVLFLPPALLLFTVFVIFPMGEAAWYSFYSWNGYSLPTEWVGFKNFELIFRNGVGMTPGRWFMNIRLNGALRELISPTADTSVTEVATRWGFRHLSRFAEQYRRAFGELPSQTLARAIESPARR